MQRSGVVAGLSANEKRADPFQVLLELTDDCITTNDLPGGAIGDGAIYTDNAQFTKSSTR